MRIIFLKTSYRLMFSHRQIWIAIDAIAAQNNMSVSRLARNAGLDPTAFNKSKRVGADGRARWPSTESLAKIMACTDTTLENLLAQVQAAETETATAQRESVAGLQATFSQSSEVPVICLSQASNGDAFDPSGFPTGNAGDAQLDGMRFPHPDGERVFAIEVDGDGLQPLYHDGDTLIVSPGSSVRKKDKVILRTQDGSLTANIVNRMTLHSIELVSNTSEAPPQVVRRSDVSWLARIIWASQ